MAKRRECRPESKMEFWERVIDETYAEYDRYLPGPQDRAMYRRKRLDYLEILREKGFSDDKLKGGMDIKTSGILFKVFSAFEKHETSPQGVAQYRRKSREYIDIINARFKEAADNGHGDDCTADGTDSADSRD